MKNVIIDLYYSQPVGDVKFHGGGEYIKSIFNILAEKYDNTFSFEVCYDTERFIDDWILDIIAKKNIKVHNVKGREDIVNLLNSHQGDVAFFAGMIYPYDKSTFNSNITTIGTCHGLRLLEKPYDEMVHLYSISVIGNIKEFIKNTFLKRRVYNYAYTMYKEAMERFNTIITDSEHSRYAIEYFYPEFARNKNIFVFYAPSKYFEFNETEISEDFIMMISADRWLKNSARGIMAVDSLYSKGLLKNVKTKIFGNLPLKIKNKIKNPAMFEFMGYVSSEELETAYKSCKIFFYPTLNEGFGLPPLEAMKYGKTCVISNVCSLPEIYSDSVYYCNPYDITEMANRLLMAVEKPMDKDIITNRVEYIKRKQDDDLEKLCTLIINS